MNQELGKKQYVSHCLMPNDKNNCLRDYSKFLIRNNVMPAFGLQGNKQFCWLIHQMTHPAL